MSDSPVNVQQAEEEIAAEVVSIPVSLLQRMSKAVQVFEEFQDELEDYLLSQDTGYLARMRQARAQHLKGQTRSLDDLKQELCID